MPRKTDIRDRILAFIVSYQEEHGYSPTMREVASGVGVSSSGCVHRHITEMKEAVILQATMEATPRTLAVNKGIAYDLQGDHKQREAIHVCLKTDTGENIVLTCCPQSGFLDFEGLFYITGMQNRCGHVIACHELSEAAYDALTERVS